MNIQPQFLTSPEYKVFKRLVKVNALEQIVKLGILCQQEKTSVLKIHDGESLELWLDLPEGSGVDYFNHFISSNLIEVETSGIRCLFFEKMNKQLISNWRNGELKSMKAKGTQCNSIEDNSMQFNSTECLGTAKAMLKQRASNASSMLDDEDKPW